MGSYIFGIRDAKIAPWNSQGSWGAAVDLDGVQELAVTLNTVNGVLEGDDEIKDVHAKVISATVRVQFAFKDLAAYATLTGETVVDSPTYDKLSFNTSNMPYFGLCGRMDETGGAGDTHFFLGKCKITEGFELAAAYGRYVTPQLTMMAVKESDTYGVFQVIQHGAETAVTIPPSA